LITFLKRKIIILIQEIKMVRKKKYLNNKWEYVNCNLCGNNNYFYINYKGENRVVKCRICGLIYRNPRSTKALDREFDSKNVYGDYMDFEEFVSDAREPIFIKILGLIDGNFKEKNRKMLDIGCGKGRFLKVAKDFGWDVEGVELAKSACRYAKEKFGIDIKNKELKEASYLRDYFDVVTMWNVLDHLTDSLDTLNEIRRILKPGGLLVIRIPNVKFHLFVHKIFIFFSFVGLNDPSIIVNYGFSKNTIRKILKKAGFMNVKVSNSPVSFGDPYKIFKKHSQYIINSVKLSYYILSNLIFYITFKRVVTGSSLLVFAKK